MKSQIWIIIVPEKLEIFIAILDKQLGNFG